MRKIIRLVATALIFFVLIGCVSCNRTGSTDNGQNATHTPGLGPTADPVDTPVPDPSDGPSTGPSNSPTADPHNGTPDPTDDPGPGPTSGPTDTTGQEPTVVPTGAPGGSKIDDPSLTYDKVELKVSGYLNTVTSSQIKLPDSFKGVTVYGYSMKLGDRFIPAEMSIKNNVLYIYPAEYLKDGSYYSIRIFSEEKQYELKLRAYDVKAIDFSKDSLFLIPAKPEKGFNYPYYLRVPRGADKSAYKRLIVEPNNSGRVSDDLELHRELAKRDAQGACLGASTAEVLAMPFIMPVFPRPLTEFWDNYYHTLSRDVMEKTSGDGKRVDLQLIAMIKDAQELLAAHGLVLEKKVFMTGFSASGQFVNRFTVLHPEWVKAVFHGGFTMYPTDRLGGNTLYFPLGTADIKELTGKQFNLAEYKKVSQFVFTCDQDKNDKINETAEDYNAYDARVMHDLYQTEDCMVIWQKKEQYMNSLGFGGNIQFHVYVGIGHGIPPASLHDAVRFFKANHGAKITKIDAIEDAWYFDSNEYWNSGR